VYVATVEDLYTRKVVGMSVYRVQLTLSGFMNALLSNPRPTIFRSYNGSEYNGDTFIEAVQTVGTLISRSAPGCPWENCYQESFCSQFEVDFGYPAQFKTLGELVFALCREISTLQPHPYPFDIEMLPVLFAL
jgi:transposase InsO family protein